MVAIFDQPGLTPLERAFRPRVEPRDPPEIFSDRALRFDLLGSASRGRTVQAPPRATDQYYREERERRDWGLRRSEAPSTDAWEAPPRRAELPSLSTSDELALRQAFGFAALGGASGSAGEHRSGPLDLDDGARTFGLSGIGGERPRVGLAALDDHSEAGFGLSGLSADLRAEDRGRVLDDGALAPSGPQSPGYRFYFGRQTGYGAGRSVGGAQSYYTPYGNQQGYPDFVERTTSSVYGGTAIVRLSPVGVFLSQGAPASVFGLA